MGLQPHGRPCRHASKLPRESLPQQAQASWERRSLPREPVSLGRCPSATGGAKIGVEQVSFISSTEKLNPRGKEPTAGELEVVQRRYFIRNYRRVTRDKDPLGEQPTRCPLPEQPPSSMRHALVCQLKGRSLHTRTAPRLRARARTRRDHA